MFLVDVRCFKDEEKFFFFDVDQDDYADQEHSKFFPIVALKSNALRQDYIFNS